jgi:hypothetical protein
MVGVPFYLRSDGQYLLIGDTGMAVCFVDYYAVLRSDRHLTLVEKNFSQYNNQKKHSHDSVTNLHILSI